MNNPNEKFYPNFFIVVAAILLFFMLVLLFPLAIAWMVIWPLLLLSGLELTIDIQLGNILWIICVAFVIIMKIWQVYEEHGYWKN